MQKSDYRNMWVYIEHDGKTAAPVGLELCCELRRLCDITGDRLYAVILDELPAAETKPSLSRAVPSAARIRSPPATPS